MMKLYNIDGCGYCSMVIDVLKKLQIEFEKIDVPWPHHLRQEVLEVSGQTQVPVLVDGDVVLDDEYDIIDYLKKTYPIHS
ncbi:MAG: glutathione S-transferase N-terminal domain-containing protein [Nitrospinota bacterium]|jgi:glutathione S-transferase|nr:glutathione S-transferase N-terminal domain-containing protein [Nitrospinota bacterium]